MAFRDDMVAIADEGRQIATDLGLRFHTVVIRTRTWSGGEPGLGTASDVDVTPDPPPKVRAPTPREITASPGVYEDGDRIVDRLSATLTEVQLSGRPVAAGAELYWLIDGDAYRLVQKPEEQFLGWRVHLRRMNKR